MNKIRHEDFEYISEYYEAKYEEFYQFLGCYFAITYPGGKKTDLQRIHDFLEGNGSDDEVTLQTIKEGREVLELQPFPWEWIQISSNRYPFNKKYPCGVLPTSEEYHEWIEWIIDTLEKEAIKAGKL